MSKEKYKLSNLELDEVSLVDHGANQLAKVVLFKRDDVKKCGSCGGTCKSEDACDGKKPPKGVKLKVGYMEKGGSDLQAVTFDKALWTLATAAAWLEEHHLVSKTMQETDGLLEYTQEPPEQFNKHRTFTPGVQICKALKLKESYMQIQNLVDAAVRQKFQPADGKSYCWVRDLFSDYAVFEQDGKTWQVPYELKRAVDGSLTVTLGDRTPVEVVYQEIGKKAKENDEVKKRATAIQLRSRLSKLRMRSIAKANSCHGDHDGKFCAGGGKAGGGSAKDFKGSVTDSVKSGNREAVKTKLKNATGEDLQSIHDSMVSQGHDKSNNPEIKHLWNTVQSEAKARGAKKTKAGGYNFV